jgi:hypothetical protein
MKCCRPGYCMNFTSFLIAKVSFDERVYQPDQGSNGGGILEVILILDQSRYAAFITARYLTPISTEGKTEARKSNIHYSLSLSPVFTKSDCPLLPTKLGPGIQQYENCQLACSTLTMKLSHAYLVYGG